MKFVIFDFDGVFTNGNIIFDDNGKPLKHYNAKDGMGIFQLHDKEIPVGVISGWRNNPSQEAILKHLKIKRMSLGSNDKLTILKEWCQELNIPLKDVAYMGDDINDLEVMKEVGFVGCPNDAVSDVKEIADFVSTKTGGNGAVREFCDLILETSFNICFCIPARMQSTRLKNKLLLPIANKSCIQHTVERVSQSKYYNENNIIVLTDDEKIKNNLKNSKCMVLMTSSEYKNGTERISKNLNKISNEYNIIVNIQADEPFVSPKNIDFCIDKHYENWKKNIFYTTLHEEQNSKEYLLSTASLKVLTDSADNVLYYSRNLVPFNKNGEIRENFVYKTFTGIYVFNRNMIDKYPSLSESNLQKEEDCEQLKILEAGYKIKSFPTIEYNEISLNTSEDYEFLKEKYKEKENRNIFYLDCTLRDGGYNNNWRFNQDFVKEYINIIDEIGIDYVEIGFLNKLKEYKGEIVGECRNIDKEYMKIFRNKSFKICAMTDYGNINLELIKEGIDIDMIRVAFHKKNFREAIQQCKEIKDMGYKISANVMGVTNYTESDLKELIELINNSKIDIVCIADSYGSLQNLHLQKILDFFESNTLSTIGIHLHNNMNNAYNNYIYFKSICNKERNYIIDSTLFGMGRGAGNLQTELIFFDKIDNEKFSKLIIFIEKYIKVFMNDKNSHWGYDLDFLYSGFHCVHPNYILKFRENKISLQHVIILINKVIKHEKQNYFDLDFLNFLIEKYKRELI